MDRKELKIQALKERISVLTMNYEDQDAERRVEITFLTQERDELKKEKEELENQLAALNEVDSDEKTQEEPS